PAARSSAPGPPPFSFTSPVADSAALGASGASGLSGNANVTSDFGTLHALAITHSTNKDPDPVQGVFLLGEADAGFFDHGHLTSFSLPLGAPVSLKATFTVDGSLSLGASGGAALDLLDNGFAKPPDTCDFTGDLTGAGTSGFRTTTCEYTGLHVGDDVGVAFDLMASARVDN